MKIKILILDYCPTDYEDSEVFDAYCRDSQDLHAFLSTLFNINTIEFEVTDQIDEENLNHICNGRCFAHWFDARIDFHSDYYQSWAFKLVDNKWIKI